MYMIVYVLYMHHVYMPFFRSSDVPTAQDATVVARPDLVYALMLHGVHVPHALVRVGPLPAGLLQAHAINANARQRQHVLQVADNSKNQ